MVIKWTERKYHVQDNTEVELKDVKMNCNTNQFQSLKFCGPHYKPHGARGMSKHYHFRFDPKLGMVEFSILRIPCVCVAFTSMLEKPWMSGISSDKQERYKPVTKFNYWPVLGAFNNWIMFQLLNAPNTGQ